MKEASWKRLLSQIHDGYVVPVIGSRLLVGEDGQQSLQRQVAERLLEIHGHQAIPSLTLYRELNDAVSRLKEGTNLQDLYTDIHEIIQEFTSDDAVIPAPLRQLAEISDFHLFVTLTPDDMFARSLRQRQHCQVNEIVHSPNLPNCEARDLPVDWHKRAGEVQLLYLFGKSSPVPTFAIHDEDLLEYAHNVITRGNRVPNGFLNELQERSLLLIGCNFSDWLARFFLRVTSKNRLTETSPRKWLVDLSPEESLTCFLSGFCKDIEILSQNYSPLNFVDELLRRWKAEHVRLREEPIAGMTPPPSGWMFFISYSRCTDRPRAEAVKQALLNLGVAENEIWFDAKSIKPGEIFPNRIEEGIQNCRYFLPLLSLSTIQREEAFVFREWREANDRLKDMNREFIIPVIVDANFDPGCYKVDAVRNWKNLDFGFAPDGVPDGRTAERFRALVREARLRKEV